MATEAGGAVVGLRRSETPPVVNSSFVKSRCLQIKSRCCSVEDGSLCGRSAEGWWPSADGSSSTACRKPLDDDDMTKVDRGTGTEDLDFLGLHEHGGSLVDSTRCSAATDAAARAAAARFFFPENTTSGGLLRHPPAQCALVLADGHPPVHM